MTQQEEKEIIRVCGTNFKETDIPAYIRDRDFRNEMGQLEAEERRLEDLEREEFFNK